MSKESKGKPGPGAYHADKSKDKAVLERIKFMGTYKSGNDKVSILEAESFAKKHIPGPQHKYKINHEFIRTKTPFYVNFKKNEGRKSMDPIKKDKHPGPSTYKTDKGFKVNSQFIPLTKNVGLSGMGHTDGARENIKHSEKVKVKSNRFFDQIVRNASKKESGPGVGMYKNPELAMDRRSAMPMCMLRKRT